VAPAEQLSLERPQVDEFPIPFNPYHQIVTGCIARIQRLSGSNCRWGRP
jgi:hypothetical protein